MNVFTETTMSELDRVIGHIAVSDNIKACILTSGKPDSFSGGADISLLAGMAERLENNKTTRGEEEANRIFSHR